MRLYIAIFAIFLLSFTSHTTAFPHYARQTRGLLDNIVDIPADLLQTALNNIISSLLSPSQCPNSTYKVDHAKYTYQAPGPNDKRGPCPGLNALANHGYLPRNGIATAAQLRDACMCITGLSQVVTTGLLIAGYMTTADLIKDQMSLGGPVDNPDSSTNPTRNLGLCHQTGIQKDASLSQTDIGLGGNCKVNLTLWEKFKAFGENSADPWNPFTFADANYARYQESKANNPTFTWQGFPFATSAIASRFAYQSFPSGLPKINTDSQYSWFVENKIPPYYKYDTTNIVGVPQVLEMVKLFIARHPDPLWIATVQVPDREECYNCWFRFLIEDTYVAYANVLQPLYNQIATYSQCTVLGCPRACPTTTTQ